MSEQALAAKGETIWVHWGKFGLSLCKVHHIGKDGRVWATRWNRRRQQWTSPQPVVVLTYPDGKEPNWRQWRKAA
jgi:hypothetical protein